jgi:hypothetical protein
VSVEVSPDAPCGRGRTAAASAGTGVRRTPAAPSEPSYLYACPISVQASSCARTASGAFARAV